VRGSWCYLYRAVDQACQTIDVLLTEPRDEWAALWFLTQAIRRHRLPNMVTIDGSRANAAAITIAIARPCIHAVADRRLKRMTPIVALPRIGAATRARNWDICRDPVVTGVFGRVVADPNTALACLARDDADDWGAIVGEGAVAFALIGPSAWRVVRVAMGRAFFPRRFGTIHPPRRRCPPSHRWGLWHSAGSGCAVVGCAAVCATGPARGRVEPLVPPWQCRAAAAPGLREADGSLRRRYRSTRCYSQCTPGTGTPESGPVHGRAADLGSRSAGIASPLGEDGVPARGYSCHRPATRLWGSRSYGNITTCGTVATHEPKNLKTLPRTTLKIQFVTA
jgi:hypothetical protein